MEFEYLQELVKEEQKTPSLKPITYSELLSKEFPETKWVVEGIVPEGGITIFAGAPGSCKTWLILELALRVSKGLPLFNHFNTTKGNILLIDEEMTERRLKERFLMLTKDKASGIYISSFGQFRLSVRSVEQLIDFCIKEDIKTIIFDSYVRIAGIKDENNAVEIKTSFEFLKPLLQQGISVILTHHHRKGVPQGNYAEAMRGSSDILASIDSLLSITVSENSGKFITINHSKSRHAEQIKPFELQMVYTQESNLMEFKYSGNIVDKVAEEKAELENSIVQYIQSENTPKSRKEIVEFVQSELNLGKTKIQQSLNKLVSENKISLNTGSHNEYFYFLSNNKEMVEMIFNI